MKKAFLKSQLASLAFYAFVASSLLNVLSPAPSQAGPATAVARIWARALSLFAVSPRTDENSGTSRRRFLQIAFRASAVALVSDPMQIAQIAAGNSTAEFTHEEILAINQLWTRLDTVARGQGIFSNTDLIRLLKFRALIENFAGKVATSKAGKSFAAKYVSVSNEWVERAWVDFHANIEIEAAKLARQTHRGKLTEEQPDEGIGRKDTSLIRVLTVAELIPADLDRQLRWAEIYQSETDLDYEESLRFMFYAAAVAVASELPDLSNQEREIFESLSRFTTSVMSHVRLNEDAINLLKNLTPDQLQGETADPHVSFVGHILGKIGRVGSKERLISPVCARIMLQNANTN